MRQAGMIAAGALDALKYHRERPQEDHANATLFAASIAQIEGVEVDLEAVETNIVIFHIDRAQVEQAAKLVEESIVEMSA